MLFRGLIHKFDKKLEEIFEAPEQHCECCGYSFPVYMIYIGSDSGEYCKSCIQSLAHIRRDEYEEAE